MIEADQIEKKNQLIYDCRICRVEQIESGFLSFYFKGNHDSQVSEVDDLVEKTMIGVGRTPFVAINDLRGNFGSLPHDVENYLINHPDLKKYKLAEAIIINGLGIRIQLNFFIKMAAEKGVLLKAFDDYDSALKWILKKKKELIH